MVDVSGHLNKKGRRLRRPFLWFIRYLGKDVPVRKEGPAIAKSEAIATHAAPGVNGYGIHGTHGRVRRSGSRSRIAKLERLRSTHRCPARDYSSFPFDLFPLGTAQCGVTPLGVEGGKTGDEWGWGPCVPWIPWPFTLVVVCVAMAGPSS